MIKIKTFVIAMALALATTVISNAAPGAAGVGFKAKQSTVPYNPGGVGFKPTQTTQQNGWPYDPSAGSVGFKVCKKHCRHR